MSRKVSMMLRIILALILIIFGLNKFANFLPAPSLTGEAVEFWSALDNAGYFTILGVLEIFAGILLLSNKWIGIALVLVASLAANFLIFHINYDLANSVPAILVTILTIALIYGNWGRFRSLL